MNRLESAQTGGMFARASALRTRLAGHRPSRGQALVELALILPVFLVLFAAALDLGRLYYSQITIHNAAKEGASRPLGTRTASTTPPAVTLPRTG